MKIAARKRPNIRIRGRSFMALVLTPIAPLEEWFAELDAQTQRAASFFQGRCVILDLSLLPREDPGLAGLLDAFRTRGVRLIGIEGADPSWEQELWRKPPQLDFLAVEETAAEESTAEESTAGESTAEERAAEEPAVKVPAVKVPAVKVPAAEEPAVMEPATATAADDAEPEKPESPPIIVPNVAPGSLLVDRAVRSGQTITYDKGDVIVVGSVSSGAEIFAGGSIHVYGTLRGRAIAGMTGDGRARIFCRRFEAELLAIEGVYRTADDIDPTLRGRPVQAWVDGDEMRITALD